MRIVQFKLMRGFLLNVIRNPVHFTHLHFFYLILNRCLLAFSDSSSDSSDSKDFEEPPVVDRSKRKKRIAQGRHRLKNFSPDGNDYDEPEGIIVISDNEDEPYSPAIKNNMGVHDNADREDAEEKNGNFYVTHTGDLSCYHDYDDPE